MANEGGKSEGGMDEINIGVVRFDSSDRIGRFGVPCVLLFQGGMRCVVNTKKETKRNQWAKIRVSEAGDAANQSAEMKTGEIMEILGPVGDFDTELKAYQLHFNILPCRYPTIDLWGLLPAIDVDSLEPGRQNCTHLRVISIDNASTRDIDDALSFEFEGAGDMATCRIGIHVADVAARVPTNSPLFEWARVRASSAYHHGPSDDGMGGGSVPMLPPQLAHGSLSLNEGQMRPAVTLWLYVKMGCIVKREHARTLIVNSCATTYALFGEDEEPDSVRSRGLLEMLSGASLPEDLVAWTMVEYNGYFGTLLAQRAAAAATSQGQGLLRVQATPDEAALYALASPAAASGAQRHVKLGLETYAHMSSPIRRFSDLFNQHILFSSLHSASLVHPVFGAIATIASTTSAAAVDDAAVKALNTRCMEIKRYHSVVDTMSLAYACRGCPRYFNCKVEASQDGKSLLVYTGEKRVRINLRDTYFAASLHDLLAVGYEGAVELCGILKAGRSQLRVRIPEVVAPSREVQAAYMIDALGNELKKSGLTDSHPSQEAGHAPVFRQGAPNKKGREQAEAIAAGVEEARAEGGEDATWAEEEAGEEGGEEDAVGEAELTVMEAAERGENFEEACELASTVMGYPIDDFQQRCLRVILKKDHDLLAMAPTGSGKTAVALLAILQAFARGQRAIYTSPIKALSNQKFAEFKEWFRKKGVKGEVSLLTGDIKIRAPPGTKNELIICTSEILRNKLVKASGIAQGAGDKSGSGSAPEPHGEGAGAAPDPDLVRLGCVVSDEVHYINDPERGAVWEETLMHLSGEVQLVALSATLRRPEDFVAWISSARGRAGEIVVRKDRHVPLHFGGLSYSKDAADAQFVSLFDTHGPRAGVFDQDGFHKLFLSAADIQKAAAEAKAADPKAAEARGSRDAEHRANALVASGGAAPKRGPGMVGSKAGGGGGGGKAGGGVVKEFNFSSEVNRLVKSLEARDKLPAIVFCMSRKACVNAALTLHGNPLLGAGPKKKPPKDDLEAMFVWEEEESERSHRVRTTLARINAMHRKHLQRFSRELKNLEAYEELEKLVRRGIAYHHAGMLPILREYVELLFQARLIKVVFATETLAVGVNMPARTVVFTQLDKPDNQGGGHRWCRTDEFWQMAGRAGRRGMDDVGFVVYAPTLSVAGERNRAPVHELKNMLTGSMPAAESQLVVDRSFVLRHLGKGFGAEVLETTLLADQLRRQSDAIRLQTQASAASSPALAEGVAAAIERYNAIDASVKGTENQFIRLSAKQLKEADKEMKAIADEHGPHFHKMREAYESQSRSAREMTQLTTRLKVEWEVAYGWLFDMGFIEWREGMPQPDPFAPRQGLTPRGYACAAFADGHPLILGTVVADGGLEQLSIAEISAWLCLFLREGRSKDTKAKDRKDKEGRDVRLPTPSPALIETLNYTDELGRMLEVELDRHLGLLMLDWCAHKDLTRIACWIEPALLGTFVKAVMRVVSYIEVLKEVVLGLGFYEVHNRLDNHHEALLGGLVTNESLYLALAEDKNPIED